MRQHFDSAGTDPMISGTCTVQVPLIPGSVPAESKCCIMHSVHWKDGVM